MKIFVLQLCDELDYLKKVSINNSVRINQYYLFQKYLENGKYSLYKRRQKRQSSGETVHQSSTEETEQQGGSNLHYNWPQQEWKV